MFILMPHTLTSPWIEKTLKWTAFEDKTSFLLPKEKGLRERDKFCLLECMWGKEEGEIKDCLSNEYPS